MFIRTPEWELIRSEYTEEEKQALRCAVSGETICPPGVALDEHRLSADLAQKLNASLQKVRG